MWAGAPKRVSGLHRGLWIVPAEMHPVSKLASTGYWLGTWRAILNALSFSLVFCNMGKIISNKALWLTNTLFHQNCLTECLAHFSFLNICCFTFLPYIVDTAVDVFLNMYLWVRMFGISWQIITAAHNCSGHENISFPLCISDRCWASQTGGPEEIVRKIMIYLEMSWLPKVVLLWY